MKFKNYLKTNKKAFTLIELIVVMAVIGILTLLAAPKFMGYTKKAKLTEIKYNIKQLENASEIYYLDKNEWPLEIDKTYTGVELKDMSIMSTNGTITLDTGTTYYGLNELKLKDYIKVINDINNYIIDSNNGNVYYIKTVKTVKTDKQPEIDYNKYFTYTINNGEITLTGLTGEGITYFNGDLIIPSTINDLSVIAIGNNAFSDNQLTSVVIPNSVTNIGEGAFANNMLTSVVFPDGITSIGGFAFYNNQLTSVVIPNSITSIGEGAFGFNQLTSVTIPNSVTTIERGVFANNQLTSVTIPNSVTAIGNDSFSFNQLTSVVIPNGVASIGDGAFNYNQLTSVVIPNSITSIGDCAFSFNQLTSVIIPDSVTNIGDYAFNENQSLTINMEAENNIGIFLDNGWSGTATVIWNVQ